MASSVDSTPKSPEELEIGLMFHLISTLDDEAPLSVASGESEAAAGLAYFKTLTDSSGGMNLLTFQNQLRRVAKRIFREIEIESKLQSIIAGRFESVVSAEDMEKVKLAAPQLNEKLLDTIPTLALAIFRLFDIDSSGSISTQEIVAMVKIAKSAMQLTHPEEGSKINPIIVGRNILSAIFRVFDENGNGVIEAVELSKIFSGWITALLNLATDIVILVEDTVKEEKVNQEAFALGMHLKVIANAENGEVSIEETLKNILANVSSEDQDKYVASMKEVFSKINSEFKKRLPDAEAKVSIISTKYQGLLDILNGKVQDGKLLKDQCLLEITPVVCDMIELFLNEELVLRNLGEPLRFMNEILCSNGLLTHGISHALAEDLVKQLVEHLRSFFRKGGLNQYLKTLFDLIDVNNDGSWSKEELVNLGKATLPFVQDWSGSALKSNLTEAIKAYLKLLDTDSSGSISPEEIKTFSGKIFDFIVAFHLLVLFMIKESVLAILLPILNILLDFKDQLVGGGSSSLSEADVLCLVALAGRK